MKREHFQLFYNKKIGEIKRKKKNLRIPTLQKLKVQDYDYKNANTLGVSEVYPK